MSGWGFIEVIESRHVVRFRETANALDGLSEGTRFACSRFSGLDLIKKGKMKRRKGTARDISRTRMTSF